MNDVLDLPTIDVDALRAPQQPMPLAPNAKGATTAALAAIDVQAVALARFGDWKPQAAALIAKYKNVAFDCTTVRGLQAATDARAEVREPRYAAQRVSKASKSELAKVSKAIGAEEQAIIDALAATEEHIDAQIRADAERRATEKAERERIEAARVAKHEAGITTIRGYVAQAQGKTAAAIERAIAIVEGLKFGTEWEEFAVPAANAQCETLEAMRALLASTQAAEQLAREAEEARAEVARKAAEQAIVAAEQKKVADQLAADKAALDKRMADFEEAQRLAAIAAQPIVAAPVETAPPSPAPAPAPAEQKPVEFVAHDNYAHSLSILKAQTDDTAAALPGVVTGISAIGRLLDAAELARGCGAIECHDGAWAFGSIDELADFIDTVRLMATADSNDR